MKLARTIITALVVLVIFLATAYAVNWGLGKKYGEGPFDKLFNLARCEAQEEPAGDTTPDTSDEQDDNYKFETDDGKEEQ